MVRTIKIAYLMHVDWNWAKQRPHFVYEQLSKKYKVDLYSIKNMFRNSKLAVNPIENVSGESYIVKKAPFSGRNNLSKRIEKLSNKKVIQKLLCTDYDLVWITSPVMLHFIPIELIQNRKVIYDCMDDYLAFSVNQRRIELHLAYEKKLVSISTAVITTSNLLKKRILERYGVHIEAEKIQVVNNAMNGDWLNEHTKKTNNVSRYVEEELYTVVYVGTIGDWIDFESLHYVLQQNLKVRFKFIGPIEIKVKDHVHPRLEFLGPVSHVELPHLLHSGDAFIMPFIKNELIEAVNPVKLYEYILFNKPIFAIKYDEIEKFKPFVSLYNDKVELCRLIERHTNVANNIALPDDKQRIEFLKEHTWETRMEQIYKVIEETV
ncbi:hypothetical protein AZ66_20195 [Paenibacillus sp. E194]|nr:hypothetical protein AZ66_20195 [Paenibacillus sp. E194]